MNSSSSKKTNNTLDMVKMGKYIAELRKRKGYTQKKLGEILDISDKTISKWELGFIAPDITLINALAIALDVTVEEILRAEDIQDEKKISSDLKSNFEIDNYKSKRRNKIIILMVFIVTIVLFVFFIHNYNKWELIKIDGKDSEFRISGYILSNKRESKIIIDKINFIDDNVKDENIYLSCIIVELYVNENKIFYKKDDVLDLSPRLDFYFNNYVIIGNYDDVIDLDDISIHIEYYEKENNINRRNVIYFSR